MTPRQHQLLVAIREGVDRTGFCPTYDQLAAALNVKSRGMLVRQVDTLVAEGYLVRVRGKHCRDIRLVDHVDLSGVSTERLQTELRRRGALA